jgi:hypothetical protein
MVVGRCWISFRTRSYGADGIVGPSRGSIFAAAERLEEFRRLWPEAKLIWEPELIQTGLKLARDPMNLDSGYDTWQELQVRLHALVVPRT